MWTYWQGMFVNRIAVFIIEHFWLNGIKSQIQRATHFTMCM